MLTGEEYFLEALEERSGKIFHGQVYQMQRGVLTSKILKDVCWTSSQAKVEHSDAKEKLLNKTEGSTQKLKDKDTPTKNN